MELKHYNTGYPIFRTTAVVIAIVQALIAIAFILGGDFGFPLAFSLSWLLPAVVLLIVGIASANGKMLTVCVALNLFGILFLWTGWAFFPEWLYGSVMSSYGAHSLFVGCATIVNVVPIIVCIILRSKLNRPVAG